MEKTFKGCGFDVDKHKDLTKQAMVELLDSLNSKDKSYATYGAIFICILSHGFEGISQVFTHKNLEQFFFFL